MKSKILTVAIIVAFIGLLILSAIVTNRITNNEINEQKKFATENNIDELNENTEINNVIEYFKGFEDILFPLLYYTKGNIISILLYFPLNLTICPGNHPIPSQK